MSRVRACGYLRRRGAGNRKAPQPQVPKATHGTFAAHGPGCVHSDVKRLPEMPDEDGRRHLFVAIDRATRRVFIPLKSSKSACAARPLLPALLKACPLRIRTDNGKAFTDRFVITGERAPAGQHVFDELCAALGIGHRLARPRRPQTSGMAGRFNGRIEEVLRSRRFAGGRDLEQTLLRYAWLHNHHPPQAAPDARTPMQAMKDWCQQRPDLFQKRPHKHPGYDS